MKLVLSTAPGEEAGTIASRVVEDRLAACVNIVPAVQSIYHWEGKICRDEEALLIMKTTPEKCDELAARIKELHSYDVPEVVCLDLDTNSGNMDYLSWIAESVGKKT